MNKSRVMNLRKELNWTQEELAEHAYVTVRTIQRLEAGEDVNSDTLRSVANALMVSINDLFETIDDEANELKIMQLAKQQKWQQQKRRDTYNIYKILLIAVIFLLMSFFGLFISTLKDPLQSILGIIWLFLIFICIALYRYILQLYLTPKLDQKYPLTIGIVQEKKPVPDNIWSFLANYWWIIFPIGGFLSGIVLCYY